MHRRVSPYGSGRPYITGTEDSFKVIFSYSNNDRKGGWEKSEAPEMLHSVKH